MRSRHSLVVRLAKAFSNLPLENLLWLDKAIHFFLPCSPAPNPTPIFLLAVPRGGSTLTYQCFVHKYNLHYLSNFWHFFHKLPFLGGLFSGFLSSILRPTSKFSSVYGFVPGLLGPAEGHHFWSRWFSCYLTELPIFSTPPITDRNYLVKVLAKLQALFPPFISCYLGHSLCLDRLQDAFPNAVFIRVKRDPVRNALSILKGIRHFSVDWFSVFPIECQSFLDRSDHFKAAAQCYFLNKRIDEILVRSDFFVVHYDDLCSSPNLVFKDFENFAARRGLSLLPSHDLPVCFSQTPLSASDYADVALLKDAFSELEDLYGALQ